MQRVLIHIHGIVQGVGFRPFIHKLVKERGLRGYIKNTSSGVELELEGSMKSFPASLRISRAARRSLPLSKRWRRSIFLT